MAIEQKQSPIRAAMSSVTGSITGGISGGITGSTLLGLGGAILSGGLVALGAALPAIGEFLGAGNLLMTDLSVVASAANSVGPGLAAVVGGGAGVVAGGAVGTFIGSGSGMAAGFRNTLPSDSPSKEELIYMERAQSTAQGLVQGAALAKLENLEKEQAELAQRQEMHEQQHAAPAQAVAGGWVNFVGGPKPQQALFIEKISQPAVHTGMAAPTK